MVSAALGSWRSHRRARIADLRGVHQAIRTPGPGRKWNTEQVNRALVLAVAAEFQGFARDLHDLAVDVFVTQAARGNSTLGDIIRRRLTDGRDLDRGNAHPGALGSDFGRLGLTLWPALDAADRRTAIRNRRLDALNAARNAIAHANDARLSAVSTEGYALNLATIERWRSSLDGLATTMDAVAARHLGHLFSMDPPW